MRESQFLFRDSPHLPQALRFIMLLAIWLSLVVALVRPTTDANAADLFVSPVGSGSSCTRSTPCSLAMAITNSIAGDSIYMGAGIYTGTLDAVLIINKNLNVYGGWNGSSSGSLECNPAAFVTTIDGQSARRGVFISGAITTLVDGITITRGSHSDRGGGLHSYQADLTLRRMIFERNGAENSTPDSTTYGGGVMVESGSLVVEDSTFRANYAWAPKNCIGGGLAIQQTGKAIVRNCLFEDNDAWHASGLNISCDLAFGRCPFTLHDSRFVNNGKGNSGSGACGGYCGGAGIYAGTAAVAGNTFTGNRGRNEVGGLCVGNSELIFSRNIISHNSSGLTSGIRIKGGTFVLTNNMVADNTVEYTWTDSPCVEIYESDGRLLNNTMVRNSGSYGILLERAAVEMVNNLVALHSVGLFLDATSQANLQATLWGTGSWANGTDISGTGSVSSSGDIHGDPAFVDPDHGDFHILPISAAINAGRGAGVHDDIDGVCRPQGRGFDIGADEYGDGRCNTFLPAIFELLGDF